MSVEAEYRCAAALGSQPQGPSGVADDETDLILHHLPRRLAAEHPRRQHIIGVVRHIAIGVRVG
jgi:hypothetical protein